MGGNIILLLFVLWPVLGAFISYLIGRKAKNARNYFVIFVAVSEFIAVSVCAALFFTGGGQTVVFNLDAFSISGLHLTFDGFRAVYLVVAAFMWMMTTLFSREYFGHYRNRNRYYFFNLLTLGATAGLFLSADLMTMFLFFELMSFTSYVWVVHDEKKEALRAGGTYLAVAVIGGLVMLMGLFLLYHEYGTFLLSEITSLRALKDTAFSKIDFIIGLCFLFGFGAKAGMFPLHIWLPKAHPVAPAPASALLSGILTKCGIFGILTVTVTLFLYDTRWGMLLLVLGVITMSGGALLALFSVDMKRILACSSVSQIGFILVGIGMQGLLQEENALAAGGTVLHMLNHSLFKLVLFLIAGVVYINLHKLNLNDIRGFGRKKPLLHFSFLMGALGISGIPLWSGYISKTLLHEGIVEYTQHLGAEGLSTLFMQGVEWIFLLTGGLTVAYMAKLYISLFWEKGSGQKVTAAASTGQRYMGRQSSAAIAGTAVLLPILGVLPHLTMDPIATVGREFLKAAELQHAVYYFSPENLKGVFISLAVGAVVYFGFVRTVLMRSKEVKADNGGTEVVKEYVDVWPVWLDLENTVYRPVLLRFLPFVCAFFSRLLEQLTDAFIYAAGRTILRPKQRSEAVTDSKTTYLLGTFADDIELFLNHTIFRKRPKNVNFVAWLSERRRDVERTNRTISRSLSFGLLMFCIGLCLTLAYLLFF